MHSIFQNTLRFMLLTIVAALLLVGPRQGIAQDAASPPPAQPNASLQSTPQWYGGQVDTFKAFLPAEQRNAVTPQLQQDFGVWLTEKQYPETWYQDPQKLVEANRFLEQKNVDTTELFKLLDTELKSVAPSVFEKVYCGSGGTLAGGDQPCLNNWFFDVKCQEDGCCAKTATQCSGPCKEAYCKLARKSELGPCKDYQCEDN